MDQQPLRKRAFLASALLHAAVLFLIIRVPLSLSHNILANSEDLEIHTQPKDVTVVYYDLKNSSLPPILPTVRMRGEGGRPGDGKPLPNPPSVGGTAFDPKLLVVVRHPQADNNRQIILQPTTAPKVRIRADIRVPDVIASMPGLVARPEAKFDPPPMVIKSGQRIEGRARSTEAAVAPQVSAASSAADRLSRLSLPAAAPAGAALAQKASASGAGSPASADGPPGTLLAIRVNPGPAVDTVALPVGNRLGEFSVSPAGVRPGSPAGVPSNLLGGGKGGTGASGDGSAGVGHGRTGGGGGASGGNGPVVVAGGGAEAAGMRPEALNAQAIASMVFPVIAPPRLPKNTFLVYSGPEGGGGLDVYGALRGGRIYTAFLRMPGKNWVLQYCQSPSEGGPAVEQRGNVVRFGEALTPPDAIEQFDFKRTAVSPENRRKVIVLYGVINKEGLVAGLKVYRGVSADLDRMALAAFERWKFHPALRGGQAIAIQVLVGIPVAGK